MKNENEFPLIDMKDTKKVGLLVKKKNHQSGFTLIEMMIVLLVISILLIVTIPNITKHNSKINETGCEAYLKMVQGEVQAYYMENKEYPESISDLQDDHYLPSDGQTTCPAGKEIVITSDGLVTVNE